MRKNKIKKSVSPLETQSIVAPGKQDIQHSYYSLNSKPKTFLLLNVICIPKIADLVEIKARLHSYWIPHYNLLQTLGYTSTSKNA